ncbi:hypothetical protein BJV82DRAFT_628406 [Fennellomyces sp. T-0311]|nr:hypothetical protein BJV82DRAFT_628406 [Fennellomyces sp. T-0311]
MCAAILLISVTDPSGVSAVVLVLALRLSIAVRIYTYTLNSHFFLPRFFLGFWRFIRLGKKLGEHCIAKQWSSYLRSYSPLRGLKAKVR